MKIRLYHSALFALLAIVALGCDDDAPAGDTTAPVINISSPQNGATIDLPGTVTIMGTIEEAGELVRLEMEIPGNFPPLPIVQTLVKEDDNFPTKTGNVYTINFSVLLNDVDPPFALPVTVNVEAEDAAGNIGTKTLNLTVK